MSATHVEIGALVRYTDELINAKPVDDYCHNGLQLEGGKIVSRLITGVTLCSELITAAIAWKSEAILVHHGLFWKGDDIRLAGMRRQRLKQLLQHDIAVLAYHLPLDFHPELGNNVLIARALGLSIERVIGKSGVLVARAAEAMTFSELQLRVKNAMGQSAAVAEGDRKQISTVGICSGGSQRYFDMAIDAGCDAYITGESTIASYHLAKETGVHFLAAGHHASERMGVKALGEHLAAKFNIEQRFVDVANPF